ncbi:MAG: tetratricopeptide repeat protein [Holophagaceae bacterium]|nr:tetratricopeptide repeat protein [Holophagaceae bacterium]
MAAEPLPGTYCQNCMTWNPGERETCRRCGTRLLLVTGDQGWEEPDEPEESDEDLDEHLLERITGLEETMRRVETYLETVSDQLGRLDRSEVMLRNGLLALVGELEARGKLDAAAFSARWEALVEDNLHLIEAREMFTRYRARILPLARPKSLAQLRRALLETAALLEDGQLPQAADRLALALPLDPKNYELAFTVAFLKDMAQDGDEAEVHARKVVSLSPRHYEAWMLLGKLLLEVPEQLDHAIAALRTAADLRPEEAEPRITLAEVLLDEEDLQGALENAQEAVGLRRSGETLSLLGEVRLARGEAALAIPILKEASSHQPGELGVRELLAESYLVAGERAKAFAILQELLQQHPGDPGLLLILDAPDARTLREARGGKAAAAVLLDEAETAAAEGDLTLAEGCLKRARRKEKTQRADWVELQIAFHKNPEGALAKLLAYSASDRHPRLCFLALRTALEHLMAQNREEDIRKALEGFLHRHPKSSGAWEAALMRQAYRLLGGHATAEDLEEVRGLYANPLPGQESRARSLLGQLLMSLNRPREVVELLDPVMEKEPTLLNHYQLGSALAALGAKEDARMVLEAALDADPADLADDQAKHLMEQVESLLTTLGGRPKARH